MIKEIKHIVENGGKVEFNYKDKLNQYYSRIEIYRISPHYIVNRGYQTSFTNIYDAVNYFCELAFSPNNAAYVQDRLKKVPEYNSFLERRLEGESVVELDEIIEKEKKLIEKEYKEMGIKEYQFPKKEDAEKEVKSLLDTCKTYTDLIKVNKIIEDKYSPIDIFSILSFVYDDGKHEFKTSTDIGVNLNSYEIVEHFSHIEVKYVISNDHKNGISKKFEKDFLK
jgi:hypothetical protein